MAIEVYVCVFKKMGLCTNPCGELPSSASKFNGTRYCNEENGNDLRPSCDKAKVISEKISPAGDELEKDAW